MMFQDFARIHGVLIESVRVSNKIQRCPTVNKPKQKNGAYHFDGERGWVFAWDGEARIEWFGSESRPWTEEEKKEWGRRRTAEKAEVFAKWHAAARQAEQLIKSARPTEHGYLQLKGFGDQQGLVTEDGTLLIPMRSVKTGELQSVQKITWDEVERHWDKKMLYGGKAKGAVFRLGPKEAAETFLCEGYATGLSIAAALRSVGSDAAVLVCFSAGNLEYVAPVVTGRRFIYADHDKSGAGERAAIATGLPYCMSDVEGHDANDDHQKLGIFAVAKKLMEVRRK